MKKLGKITAILLGIMILMSLLTVNAKATVSTSVVFDAEFYLSKYADLRAAFGNDADAAYNHFLTYGIKEGRQASPLFDVSYYLSYYEDLQLAFGSSNYEAAYNHFLTYGVNEGRRSSEVFDVSYYLNSYEDLTEAYGTDYETAYLHALVYGMSEGRDTSENFQVSCYLSSYEDLAEAFGSNYELAFDHYYLFGISEGRHAAHSIVTKDAVEATCVAAGSTGTQYCEYCGTTIAEAETIAATGEHTYGEGVVTTEATCTETGIMTYTCTVCETTTTEEIAATGHTHADSDNGTILTRATCTTEGEREYTCTVCGETYTEVIEATGHKMTKVDEVSATCTEDGTVEYYVCAYEDDDIYYVDEEGSAVYEDEEDMIISATGHDLEEVEDSEYDRATCTEDGIIEYECTVCGHTVYEVEAALGHDYSVYVGTTASCTEEGVETYQCSRYDECGSTYEKDVDATHTVTTWDHEVDATCTTEGYRSGICDVCGEAVMETTDMIDHTYDDGEITKQPTCTTDGVMTYTCTVCGNTAISTLLATGHDDQNGGSLEHVAAKDATCEEDGNYEYYYCATCYTCFDGEDSTTATELNYDTDILIDATGHSYALVAAVDPTCSTEGNIEYYTCENCDLLFVYDEDTDTYEEVDEDDVVLDIDDHDYSIEVDDDELLELYNITAPTCEEAGQILYVCSYCGNSYYKESVDALGHTWDGGETTTDATCEEEGVITYTCTVCGDTEEEAIIAIGHDYGEIVASEDYDGLYEKVCGNDETHVIYYADADGETEYEAIEVSTYAELVEAIQTVESDSDTNYIVLITADITTESYLDLSTIEYYVMSGYTLTNENA